MSFVLFHCSQKSFVSFNCSQKLFVSFHCSQKSFLSLDGSQKSLDCFITVKSRLFVSLQSKVVCLFHFSQKSFVCFIAVKSCLFVCFIALQSKFYPAVNPSLPDFSVVFIYCFIAVRIRSCC